jgi:hypothetical protein
MHISSRFALIAALVGALGCESTSTPDAARSADAFASPDAGMCRPSGAACEAGEDCCSGACGIGSLTCT